MKATDVLEKAAKHMRDRAATYDKPEGERSMAKTVAAFNAITGKSLSVAEGWLFMAVLKQVRVFQNPARPHQDSLEDGVAYAALLAEEMLTAADQVATAPLSVKVVLGDGRSCSNCLFHGHSSSRVCGDCDNGSNWKSCVSAAERAAPVGPVPVVVAVQSSAAPARNCGTCAHQTDKSPASPCLPCDPRLHTNWKPR